MRNLLIPFCFVLFGCSSPDANLVGEYKWTAPNSTVRFIRGTALNESWFGGGSLSLKGDSTFTLTYPSGSTKGNWHIEGDSIVLVEKNEITNSTAGLKKYGIQGEYLRRQVESGDKNLIELLKKTNTNKK